MSGTDSFKSKVAEMVRRIRKGARGVSGRPSSKIDEIAADVQKRKVEVRRHVEDTNGRIERGIRPDGEKFRL